MGHDKYELLKQWHILVQGFTAGNELQSVVQHARMSDAPTDSLYFDYQRAHWVTRAEIPTWEYERFLKLRQSPPQS